VKVTLCYLWKQLSKLNLHKQTTKSISVTYATLRFNYYILKSFRVHDLKFVGAGRPYHKFRQYNFCVFCNNELFQLV
jgi:hypothetical protein